MTIRASWLILLVAMMTFAMPATAQDDPSRIVRPMTPIDSVTLQAEGLKVTLWGIKPISANETLELKALDLLDRLIETEPVTCKIIRGSVPNVVASCISASRSDLGLELLNNGYAVVDRPQVAVGGTYAATYIKAQDAARVAEKGIWRQVAGQERQDKMPPWLAPYLPAIIPIALILGPLGGLLVTIFMMRYWLGRMIAIRQEEDEYNSRKESALQARERYVLLATLEGELSENKNKISAFVLIYNDMLQELKNPKETPKYQQVGDIVQKHPAFSKVVFEANMAKMSLLEVRLAGQLSKFYTSLPGGHEYLNLDPGVPLQNAIKMVEDVVRNAERFVPDLDKLIKAVTSAANMKSAAAAPPEQV